MTDSDTTPPQAPKAPWPTIQNLRPPWQKGQSGNPGGVGGPIREAQAIAKVATPAAMRRLVELMDDPDPRVALIAANSVLDRAMGKPKEPAPDRSANAAPVVFRDLSDEELTVMRKVLQRSQAAAERISDGPVIDQAEGGE